MRQVVSYAGNDHDGPVYDKTGAMIGWLRARDYVPPVGIGTEKRGRLGASEVDLTKVDPSIRDAVKRQLGGCKGCGDPGAQELANG